MGVAGANVVARSNASRRHRTRVEYGRRIQEEADIDGGQRRLGRHVYHEAKRLLRGDGTPDELVTYCFHALNATSGMRSRTAVRRVVAVTLTALRPRD